MDDVQRRRREELADFLKAARGRLDPEAHGLPAGGRRRTPGLRREEVAQAAGVGLTWYTWLEQARPINVSQQVVLAVARALALTPDETNHVLTLAGFPRQEVAAGDYAVTTGRRAVLEALRPHPAVILDAKFDVLAWNQAYRFLHDDIEAPRALGTRGGAPPRRRARPPHPQPAGRRPAGAHRDLCLARGARGEDVGLAARRRHHRERLTLLDRAGERAESLLAQQ